MLHWSYCIQELKVPSSFWYYEDRVREIARTHLECLWIWRTSRDNNLVQIFEGTYLMEM